MLIIFDVSLPKFRLTAANKMINQLYNKINILRHFRFILALLGSLLLLVINSYPCRAQARDNEEEKSPLFAVSTNIVLDAAITPNVNIEVPIGKQWSAYTEYTFPWWVTKGNNRAWQIQKWDLGGRYWFNRHQNPMDVLSGHFVGLDIAGGYYDIEPNHRGWQGEAIVASLEYGYSWLAARNWRVQVYIGAGWMGTGYRYYRATEGDQHLIYQNTGRFTWLGPTKAGVSIQYLFHYNKKHKRK